MLAALLLVAGGVAGVAWWRSHSKRVPAAAPLADDETLRGRALATAPTAASLADDGTLRGRALATAPTAASLADDGTLRGRALATAPTAASLADDGTLRGRALATLRSALRQPAAPARVLAADALGEIRDQPSRAMLSELAAGDPDAAVRGRSALALGALGDASAGPALRRLEDAAPPRLKPWYAAGLARLGEGAAAQRLSVYAADRDPAVALSAGLLLADAHLPGDAAAVAALKKLAARESELVRGDPAAPVTLAMKLAGLRDPGARRYLVGLLGHPDAGARLAAAEALAQLRDDAGRGLLDSVIADPTSPDRLAAAVAEIPLGRPTGAGLIAAAAADPQPGNRRLAARGLGALGDRRALAALVRLAGDPDWTVRVTAARAIVEIVRPEAPGGALAGTPGQPSASGGQSDQRAQRPAAGGP